MTFRIVGAVLVGVFLSACGMGSLTEAESINGKEEIYAAAVRQLVEGGESTSFFPTRSEILIVDYFPRRCFHNGAEWICTDGGAKSDPVDPISEDIKSAISSAIQEIAPSVRFIDNPAQFIIDKGRAGAWAIPNSIIITLDPVEFDEDGATVSVTAWCGVVCSVRVTYRVIEEPKGWAVTETLNVVVS